MPTPRERIYQGIRFLIRGSLVVAAVGAAVEDQWQILFVTCLAFLLTFVPYLLQRNYRIRLPVEFEFTILLFVYATLFLGNVHRYYTRFWWWDIVMHTGSGLVLGIIGFLIIFALFRSKRVAASPLIIALFSFSFAVMIGALWEIFEFTMDQLFATHMQRSGLVDTMWDLIVDSVGAFVASVVGYFYLLGRRWMFFDRAIDTFIEKNPELFS